MSKNNAKGGKPKGWRKPNPMYSEEIREMWRQQKENWRLKKQKGSY